MSDEVTIGRRPGRSATLSVAVVAAVALLALVLRLTVFAPEEALPGIAREPAPSAAGLTFLDHASDPPREVELTPPPGQLRLVYFGYLSCPDVCPMTMSDIVRAEGELTRAQAARTSVAFVTVDPERDDPERLRRYMSVFFDDGWLALTARDRDELDAAATRLGVRYEIEAHEAGAERYGVDHSAITYIVDDTGAVVRELPFGVTSEEIARVLRALLPA